MSFYNLAEFKRRLRPGDLQSRRLDGGQNLFEQGNPVNTIYFVEEGEIIAERFLANGETLTLFRAVANQTVGEEALFFPERLYSATAVQPTRLLFAQKSIVLERLESSREFRANVTHCLAERYLDCLMHREFLRIKNADQRILCWLNWMREKLPGDLDLSGRMGTIGAELGLTRESVYRALAKLEKKGAIKRSNGVINLAPKAGKIGRVSSPKSAS